MEENKIPSLVTREELHAIIRGQVTQSILNYINKEREPATFHPLDYMIAEQRRIRSKVGGLETSLGQSFWEKLAKAIAGKNGFEVKKQKLKQTSHELRNLADLRARLLEDRSAIGITAQQVNERVKADCQRYLKNNIEKFTGPKKGIGVDIWLYKDGTHYLYDIKTVQPNMAKFASLYEQIVDWYICFYAQYPDQTVECRIVFPYNPYRGKNFWDCCIGRGKPLEASNEGLVEDEFWDQLSGHPQTGKLILETFKEVAEDTKVKASFEKFLGKKNEYTI